MYIYLKGLSSKTTKEINLSPNDLKDTLMNTLHRYSVAIASSCRGELVCQRCTINSGKNKTLACGITVERYIDKYGQIVEVDYL